MKKIISIFFVSASLIGCASIESTVAKAYVPSNESQLSLSVKKDSGVSIPSEQGQLLENQIREGLSKNGLTVSNEINSQHSVIVIIHTFKMRADGARLFVGILAGCDDINSTVIVTDKLSGKEIGNAKISINECAAWGVASQVITKFTDGVVAYLTNK